MAYEQPGFAISREAGEDLSAFQFCFVKLDTNGRIVKMAAVTDIPVGVLQDKPRALGHAGNVMVSGISKVVGGANLANGDTIQSDATGRAIVAAATGYVAGRVLGENNTAGGMVSALIDCAKPVLKA